MSAVTASQLAVNCTGLAHARRIASVFGAGAEALRTGWAPPHVRATDHADGTSDYGHALYGAAKFRGCAASWPAVLADEGADVCDPPTPPRAIVYPAIPVNWPPVSPVLAPARALCAAIEALDPALTAAIAMVRCTGRDGWYAEIHITHTAGGNGRLGLRTICGESHLDDNERSHGLPYQIWRAAKDALNGPGNIPRGGWVGEV